MTPDEIRARLDEIRSRITEINEEYPNAALPDEARDEWNRLDQEREQKEELLAELEQRQEAISALSDDPTRSEPATGGLQVPRPGVARGEDIYDLSTVRGSAGAPQEIARELRDRGLRAIERMRPAHERADREAVQGHVERLAQMLDGEEGGFSRHLLVTGSPAYERAFMRGISRQALGTEEQRALNLTGETGGFLLPFTLDPTIIPTSDGVVNPLRSIANVKQTLTDTWKGVSSGGMKAKYREAEDEETTDDSPKFAQPEVSCEEADAFAQWTYSFGQDYGSIAPELAILVQDAKDELEAVKMLSGSGTKEPFGLATGATELIETITKEAFAVGDLYALEEALGPRFRSHAQFVGNRAIYNKTRQFDTNGGASLWVRLQDGLANTPNGNMGRRLLDYPTNELSTMQATVTKLKTILFFGDFRYFVIADRIGMLAKPIDNIPGPNGRPTGQAGLYFFWRNGSKVMSKAAFRGLKVKE